MRPLPASASNSERTTLMSRSKKKARRDGGVAHANPFARQTAERRQVVLDCMPVAELQLITRNLMKMALQGNIPAVKLVYAYAIGKPERCPDPDEIDRHEWETRKRLAVEPHELRALTGRMAADQACAVAEATQLPVAVQVAREVADYLMGRGLLGQTQPVDTRGEQPPPTRPAPAPTPAASGTGHPRPEVRNGNKV